MGLVPESVAERYAAPGVRFVPLGGDQPTSATAVLTRRGTDHIPTVAFLRAVSALVKPGRLSASAGHGRHGDRAESDRQ